MPTNCALAFVLIATALSSCTATKRAGERLVPPVIGTSAGVAVGLVVGGPIGAGVGAAVAAVVTSIATPDCAELYASGSSDRSVDTIRSVPGTPQVTHYESPPAPSRPWKALGCLAALACAWWQRKRLASLASGLWAHRPHLPAKLRRKAP